jgi:hypothetical protein
MWIASKYGFFSIVLKDGHYNIRARARADLEALLVQIGAMQSECAMDPPRTYCIEHWPTADYAWRIRIPVSDDDPPHNMLSGLFAILADSIDYPNFKSQIAATPGQRDKLPIYHEIWHLLYDYQEAR